MKEHKPVVRIISWDGNIPFSSLLLDVFRFVASACLAEIGQGYVYTIKVNAQRLSSGTDTTGMEWSISTLLSSLSFQSRTAVSNMLLGNCP